MAVELLVLVNVLGMLSGEPKDADKVVSFFNDGSIPVTITMDGADPVTLAPHERASRKIPEFGTHVVVADSGEFRPRGRSFIFGDEDAFYKAPRTLHWCVVARNHTLNLLPRQECAGRVEH